MKAEEEVHQVEEDEEEGQAVEKLLLLVVQEYSVDVSSSQSSYSSYSDSQ